MVFIASHRFYNTNATQICRSYKQIAKTRNKLTRSTIEVNHQWHECYRIRSLPTAYCLYINIIFFSLDKRKHCICVGCLLYFSWLFVGFSFSFTALHASLSSSIPFHPCLTLLPPLFIHCSLFFSLGCPSGLHSLYCTPVPLHIETHIAILHTEISLSLTNSINAISILSIQKPERTQNSCIVLTGKQKKWHVQSPSVRKMRVLRGVDVAMKTANYT